MSRDLEVYTSLSGEGKLLYHFDILLCPINALVDISEERVGTRRSC